MDSKKINFIWAISLFAIGITTMILAAGNPARAGLTDSVVRLCGAIDLVSLPVFAFSTVKKRKTETD